MPTSSAAAAGSPSVSTRHERSPGATSTSRSLVSSRLTLPAKAGPCACGHGRPPARQTHRWRGQSRANPSLRRPHRRSLRWNRPPGRRCPAPGCPTTRRSRTWPSCTAADRATMMIDPGVAGTERPAARGAAAVDQNRAGLSRSRRQPYLGASILCASSIVIIRVIGSIGEAWKPRYS